MSFYIGAIKYKDDSTCSACKKSFALKETWQPIERQIKVKWWYRINRIRYYKCKFCWNEEELKINDFIEDKNI